jgi:aminoglycoside 6'-N-acetyltransferase I
MREALWPSSRDWPQEIEAFWSGVRQNPAEVLIAVDDSGQAMGFAEMSIRPYAAGCHSGRVAYLEGLFVKVEARRQGVGAALVRAVEDWGRSQGCTELGSDADISNLESAAVHSATGFAEVERIICFRKELRP